MKTNITEENNLIADELGIPRLKINQAQKIYYPYHFRQCAKYLQWIGIINFLLVLLLLFLFFSQTENDYYLTAFDGKITQIYPKTLDQAIAVTQKQAVKPEENS